MPRPISPEERQRIEDELVRKMPDGYSDEEFDRVFAPKMAEALGIAENTSAPLHGSAMSRALSGLWQTLNPVTIAKGVAQTAMHPIDTASNILGAQADQFRQGNQAQSVTERVGHYAAGLLPVLGPAAASVGQGIAETGDIATGVGQGAGLIAPFVAGPVARGVGRVTTKALGEGTAAAADASAAARLTEVMAPKVGANKARFGGQAADVAPQLAREEGMGALSREGLHTKVAGKLQEAEAGLDDAANARLASQQVQTSPLVQRLDDLIGEKTAQPVDASKVTPTKTNLNASGEETVLTKTKAEPFGKAVEPAPNSPEIGTLRRIRDEIAQLGPVAPYEAIRRIREAWDKVAKVKYMPSTAQDVLKAQGDATGAYKATGAIRDALAEVDPATAAANKNYSLYRTANDVMEATAEAERVRPRIGRGLMRTAAGATAGAVSGGGVGAAIGATVGAIVNRAVEAAPTLQIVIARRLAAVADAIRAGEIGQAQAILQRIDRQLVPSMGDAAKAGTQAGRVVMTPTTANDSGTPEQYQGRR